MRVLFVTHYTGMLGANRSLLQLMIELREKGVSPTVLMPQNNGAVSSPLLEALDKEDIPYIEAPIRSFKHPVLWKSVASYALMLWLRKKVISAIGNMKFDIVHSNSSVIDIGAYIASNQGIPHVWHLREFGDLDYNFKTPFGKWFQRIIYRGNNHFIAISKKIASHFAPYVGNQPISVIYNGIKPVKKSSHTHKDFIQFCIVGLIHPNKRQSDVLQAANLLVKEFGLNNFHVTIIGDGIDSYVASLKDYVKINKLTEFITFTGNRNDVPELLKSMDVGIMASSNEAFGRVTVEYMMYGLAVIASDGGANKEIIEDEESGLIYLTSNYKDLANKMQIIINRPTLLNKISQNGYNRALTLFSSISNSNKIYELYQQILG